MTFVAFGATFIGMALYNAIGIGWRETTLGKQAVGLVVRAEDGSRAGYGRAFNRGCSPGAGRGAAERLHARHLLDRVGPRRGGRPQAPGVARQDGPDHGRHGRGERRPKAQEAPLPAESDDAALPAEDVRPAAA